MRWQLINVSGQAGELSAVEALTRTPVATDEQGQSWISQGCDRDLPMSEGLWQRLRPWLDPGLPTWVILPYSERTHRAWWQGRLSDGAELGFGRASVALALSQLNRLAAPGRIIAVNRPAANEPGIEAVMALDWGPADHGLAFELTQMDGRLDGKTDVGALLELGRNTVHQPEVLFCPGTAGDGYIERLLPFLGALGPWAAQEVRWEFAEAPLGRLGVVGSLFSWAWLEAGYRLGEWQDPCAVIELDDSPLAGLSVVSWTTGVSGASARLA